MSERIKYMGRREEQKIKARRLKIVAHGLVKSLRENLDPFADISELKGELITEQAFELADTVNQYNEAMQKIDAINKALGE